MIAENSASSSSYDVRISAAISGRRQRISRHTSMPDPSGSRPSRTATSGRSAGIRRAASWASPDSPTTSMSPSLSSSSRMPRRTISWSSSRKTRIFSAVGLVGHDAHATGTEVRRTGREGPGEWDLGPCRSPCRDAPDHRRAAAGGGLDRARPAQLLRALAHVQQAAVDGPVGRSRDRRRAPSARCRPGLEQDLHVLASACRATLDSASPSTARGAAATAGGDDELLTGPTKRTLGRNFSVRAARSHEVERPSRRTSAESSADAEREDRAPDVLDRLVEVVDGAPRPGRRPRGSLGDPGGVLQARARSRTAAG